MTHRSQSTPTVAAFDFDGTLTFSDSLLFFLFHCFGICKTLLYLFALVPAFFLYAFRLLTRQEMKERVLKKFFRGISISQIQAFGNSFAKNSLHLRLRPNALSRIQWHLDKGHQCVLVSASLSAYLHPWAKSIGFKNFLTSELALDSQGYITGVLQGKNCWGAEKARRLSALLGPREKYVLYVYGDSRGDQELLQMADYAYYRTLEPR